MHNQIGPVIVDLIEELEIQLDQEFYAYYKVDSPKLRQALPTSAPPKPLITAVLIDKQESTVKSAPVVGPVPNVKSKFPTSVQVRITMIKSRNYQVVLFKKKKRLYIRKKLAIIRNIWRACRENRTLSLDQIAVRQNHLRYHNLWLPRLWLFRNNLQNWFQK